MVHILADGSHNAAGPYAGVLHIFVAFDWGEEVDLDHARRLLPAELHNLPRRLRTPPSIAYQSPPLRFPLPAVEIPVPIVGRTVVSADLMLFDFGAASLAFQCDFRLHPEELTRLAGELADPTVFIAAGREACRPIFDQLRDAIVHQEWADLSEEYFVFQLLPQSTQPSPEQLLAQYPHWLAGLVHLEAGPLSETEIAEALRLRSSYSPQDLIITDWAAAVVVDSECAEVLETIAFANLQLLEFRHIDQRLDSRLKTAYDLIHQLAHTRLPIWQTHARRLRGLRELKAEMNEMFERASDALTLVGDPYIARVFQQLSSRFHLDDWGRNIRRSISVLEGIYQSVSDQVAIYRTEVLEVVVIILILMEILLTIFRH
ncbi:MAG: hypothetical protein JSS02_05115 [Planctomycetes bacterium]|nr:hypothetical protein [Planctomycetota bacterium]